MKLKLVKLTPEYQGQLIEMLDEWKADIEQNHTNRSPSTIFRNDHHDFDYYMDNLEFGEGNPEGRVPDEVWFCLDQDRNIFVGAVNIRRYLNSYIYLTGGHIGDGIRPSERRKGYATEMIRLALAECRRLGINKVLMTCSPDNIGSAKSIMNNGGIYEGIGEEDGEVEQRYWITLEEEAIETERLLLKRATPFDADAVTEWNASEQVCEFLKRSPQKEPEAALDWLRSKDPNAKDAYLMMLRDKTDGRAIGLAAAFFRKEQDLWSLAYQLSPQEWGKGYATEAMQALTDYLEKIYGAHTFEAECARANTGSCRVAEKLGLRPERESRYTKNDGSRTYCSIIFQKHI